MEDTKFGDFEILDEALKGITGDVGEEGYTKEGDINLTREGASEEDSVPDSVFKDERTNKSSKEDVGIKDDEDDDFEDTADEELKDESDDSGSGETDEPKDEGEETSYEFGEEEPDLAAVVQEKLFEEMGWELEEGETPFKTISEAVDYMKKIVNTNSTPVYASDDIEALNDFVNAGGDIKDYFDVQPGLNLKNADTSDEDVQKQLVKEALLERGFSVAQADKKVNRYDETGILEDEAEDSLEFLQKTSKRKTDKLLKEQEESNLVNKKQQQKFYNDVESYIDSLEDIRGINLTKAKRNKLKKEALNLENDGTTAYQKKYKKNLIKNFVESAYFTIEDDVIKGLERKAESKATQSLKKKLATKTKRGRSTGIYEDSSSTSTNHSALDIFSSFNKP